MSITLCVISEINQDYLLSKDNQDWQLWSQGSDPFVETTLDLHWLAYRQNGVKHYAFSFSRGGILFNQNCCQRAKHLTQFPFNVTKNSPERPDRSRHTDEQCYETVLCNYLQYTIYMYIQNVKHINTQNHSIRNPTESNINIKEALYKLQTTGTSLDNLFG